VEIRMSHYNPDLIKEVASHGKYLHIDTLISMMEKLEIIEIFRKQTRKSWAFHMNPKHWKFAQEYIFFWLLTLSLVVNIATKASNAHDHRAMKLSLKRSEERRVRGLWMFNNSLVDDEGYVNRIRKLSHYRWKIPRPGWSETIVGTY